MGNWNISIQGTGCHHNFKTDDDGKVIGQLETDADKMAKNFVRQLQDAGHNVESATITTGGRYDLKDNA